MRPDDQARLLDMFVAARKLQRFLSGVSQEQFLNDEEKQFAVLRAIEIIGEAANHVSDETKELIDRVPWDEIHGIRNRIAHAYFAIDLETVWDTVESDLDVLMDILAQYIEPPDDSDDFASGAPVKR